MATTECPDCEVFFVGARCACGYQAPQAARGAWKPLVGRPLTKEQNSQCNAIFQAVMDGRKARAEGVAEIMALGKAWGFDMEGADQ